MYAMKIRKSNLDILTMLNEGVTPEIEKTTTYLIIRTDAPNDIVTERELHTLYDISMQTPLLLKLTEA